MSIETIEELEEALDDILPAGFSIETNKHGQVVIFTGLKQDEDGQLTPMHSDDGEEEDFDPDTESLEDDDIDDDD